MGNTNQNKEEKKNRNKSEERKIINGILAEVMKNAVNHACLGS